MAVTIKAENNAEKSAWDIKLSGEIDISNADQVKAKIDSSLAEAKQNILIDLSGLTYIDSTGLGVFIAAHSSLKKEGLGVKVYGATGSVKKLLTVSSLDKILS